ncbi:Protein argonaute 6 isoform C [Glycine soja]|uniref:Protein argonaute 6 isoform C n=1 Tax=Glycine soja TaxID=3848 RepID=A0A445JF20_GLYSO|nr:Protein argonaute 6 isoform C [Glycine soja]
MKPYSIGVHEQIVAPIKVNAPGILILAFVMWHSRIQRCRYHHLLKSLEEYLVKLLVVFLIVEFGQENHHYHYLTRDTDHPPTVQPSCPVLQPSSCPVSWVLSELV